MGDGPGKGWGHLTESFWQLLKKRWGRTAEQPLWHPHVDEKKVFLSQYSHINVYSVEKHALLFFHNKYTNVCVNVNGCEWVCVAGDLWVCGNLYVCAFECLCHCVWCVHGCVRMGTCLSVPEWEVSLTSEWRPLDVCLVHSRAWKTVSGSSKRWANKRLGRTNKKLCHPKITEDGLC